MVSMAAAAFKIRSVMERCEEAARPKVFAPVKIWSKRYMFELKTGRVENESCCFTVFEGQKEKKKDFTSSEHK